MLRIQLLIAVIHFCFSQTNIFNKADFISPLQSELNIATYKFHIKSMTISIEDLWKDYGYLPQSPSYNVHIHWVLGEYFIVENKKYYFRDFPKNDVENLFISYQFQYYVTLENSTLKKILTVHPHGKQFLRSGITFSSKESTTFRTIKPDMTREEIKRIQKNKNSKLLYTFGSWTDYGIVLNNIYPLLKKIKSNEKSFVNRKTEKKRKTDYSEYQASVSSSKQQIQESESFDGSKNNQKNKMSPREKYYKKQWEKSLKKTDKEAKDALNKFGNLLENLANQNREESHQSSRNELSREEKIAKYKKVRSKKLKEKYRLYDQLKNPWLEIPYQQLTEKQKKYKRDFSSARGQLLNPNYKYPKNVKRTVSNLEPTFYELDDYNENKAIIAYYLLILMNEYMPLDNLYHFFSDSESGTKFTYLKMKKAEKIKEFAFSLFMQILPEPGIWNIRYEEFKSAKEDAEKYLTEYKENERRIEEKKLQKINYRLIKLINDKEYEKAILEANKHLINEPEDVDVLSYKSKAQIYSGNRSNAIHTLQKILKIEEYHQESLYNIAITYYNLQNLEKASYYFKKYRNEYPEGNDVSQLLKATDVYITLTKINKLFNEFNTLINSDKNKAKKILLKCESILINAVNQSYLNKSGDLWEALATVYQYLGKVKEHKNALENVNKYKN